MAGRMRLERWMDSMKRWAMVAGAVLLAGAAQAENWPSRLIKATIPFGAGSAADVVPRVVFDRLASRTRPGHRRGKSRRRRRHNRHRGRREGGCGRLQYPRPILGAGDFARDLPRLAFQYHPGPDVGLDDRRQRQCHDRAGFAAMEDRPGFHRGCQGEARLDRIRVGRRRQCGAHQCRKIPPCGWNRNHPCALSRRRGGDRRYSRRPDRFLFLPARNRATPDQGGPGPCTCDLDAKTRCRFA